MNDQPSLPYEGTEGWSGSETSKERAYRDAMDGTASARQRAVIDFIAGREFNGATWFEVANALALHHGQASGSLTALHKDGRIERLTEIRGRCQIYVLPPYIGDRDIAPYRPNKSMKDLLARITELEREKKTLLDWIDDLENEVQDLKEDT